MTVAVSPMTAAVSEMTAAFSGMGAAVSEMIAATRRRIAAFNEMGAAASEMGAPLDEKDAAVRRAQVHVCATTTAKETRPFSASLDHPAASFQQAPWKVASPRRSPTEMGAAARTTTAERCARS